MEPAFSFRRYCGEIHEFTLTTKSNILEVMFHSDESYTDKGFSAEYSSYDPSNRESTDLSNATHVSRRVPGDTTSALKACHYWARRLCWLAAAAEWHTNRVLASAAETGRVQLEGSTNHTERVYWVHFICHCQSGNTLLSILWSLRSFPVWLKWIYNCSDQLGQTLTKWWMSQA